MRVSGPRQRVNFERRNKAVSQTVGKTAGKTAGQAPAAVVGKDLETSFPEVLSVRRVPVTFHHGKKLRHAVVGYLRIWSFDVHDHEAFVTEVDRLLKLLPQDRLIVDLRGNPGGLIWAAERLLQLFSDKEIQPTRFSLLATPLTRAMAESEFNHLELDDWLDSLTDAVSTGEVYSKPIALTDPSWCRDIGRTYPGAAVLVVDPNTYSSGDLFAAGWADHEIGPLISIGEATGAGGANVWGDLQLNDALSSTPYAFDPLPGGVQFTMAIRRAIRSGVSDGIPIEDLGIRGIPYAPTRRDLMDGNKDLYNFCAQTLHDRT